MSTKAKLTIGTASIEIEGSEEFVARQLDLFHAVVKTTPRETQTSTSPKETSTPSPAKPEPRAKPVKDTSGATRSAGKSGGGAVAILAKLVESDYFKTPRTIKDLVDHCSLKLARKFPQSAFSGALARHVRNQKLERKKNADEQYEYTLPA